MMHMPELLTREWVADKLPVVARRPELWPLAGDGVLCLLGTGESEAESVARRWWLAGVGELAQGEGLQRAARVTLDGVPLEAVLGQDAHDAACAALQQVLRPSLELRRRRAVGLAIMLDDAQMHSAADEQASRFLADLQAGQDALRAGLSSPGDAREPFVAAERSLRSAVDGFKHDPVTHFLMGWLALFRAGDASSARGSFERALACRRVDSELRCFLLRHIAAALSVLAELDTGQAKRLREQAVDAISEAMTVSPEDPLLQWETARLCLLTDRATNAKRILTELLSADPLSAVCVALDPVTAANEEDALPAFSDARERARRAAKTTLDQAGGVAQGLAQVCPEECDDLSGAAWDSGTSGDGGDAEDGAVLSLARAEEFAGLEGLSLAQELYGRGSQLGYAAAGILASEAREDLIARAHSALTRRLAALEGEREQIAAEASEVFEAVAELGDEPVDGEEALAQEPPLSTLPRTLLRGAAGLLVTAAVCVVLGGHLTALGWALLGLAAMMSLPQLLQLLNVGLGFGGSQSQAEAIDPEEAWRLRQAAIDFQQQIDELDGRIAEVSGVLSQLAA